MSKISSYTALTNPPAATDLLVIVDVTDTTMAATGTTKKITLANLARLALLPSPFNVKSYGAAGDGVTDDTSAINAAIAAAHAAGAGAVWFPAGTYIVNSALTLYSDVTLRGEGAYLSIIKVGSSPSGTRVLDMTGGPTGVTVEKLGFDGSSGTVIYKALETGGTTQLWQLRIRDCAFTNWVVPSGWTQSNPDIGAILIYSSSGTTGAIWIEGCDFITCVKGVRVYNPTDGVFIRGNRFYNTAVKGMQVAVETTATASGIECSGVIEGNHIDGANWDPSSDPGGQLGCGIITFGTRGLRIAANHVQNCGDPASQQVSGGGVGARASLGGGILLSNGSHGCEVTGNTVHDCQQHGIYVQLQTGADTTVGSTGTPRGAIVSGNTVYKIKGVGNAASSASRTTIIGINVNYGAGTVVSGNQVHDTAHPGISADSDHCAITGNVVYNCWQATIPSVAPTLGTGTGTLPSGNYTIGYTYVFTAAQNQESIVSPTATVTLNGSQDITIGALTSIPGGVTAVKFYIYSTTSSSTTGYTGVSAAVSGGATSSTSVNAQGNSVPPPDYTVAKGGVVVTGSHVKVSENQVFDNQAAKTTQYGVAVGNVGSRITGNDLSGVSSTGVFAFGGATSNYYAGNAGYNPVGQISTPVVPGSGSPYTNQFGVDATVFVTGGSGVTVSTYGVSTGLSSGTFRVPNGQTITLTYSSAPSWTWFGD